MKHTLYLVRGAPASGKTTLTPLLASLLPQPVALLEQDNWRWGIHLAGRTIADIEKSEHDFADALFLKTIEEYLALKKYTLIVEGLFSWNDPRLSHLTVKKLTEITEKYGYNLKSIVLTAEKSTLIKRNNKRPYSVPKDEFNQIYDAVYSTIDLGETTIDSSDLSIEETLKKLKKEVL